MNEMVRIKLNCNAKYLKTFEVKGKKESQGDYW